MSPTRLAAALTVAALGLLFAGAAGGTPQNDFRGRWRVTEGSLRYTVSISVDEASGTSKAVHGRADCEASRCEFTIEAPVRSFRSGDAKQDEDMMRTLKAARYPQITVAGRGRLQGESRVVVDCTVRLGGKAVDIGNVPFDLERKGDRFTLHGRLRISLPAFALKPPTVLGVPVADEVAIAVALTWERA